MGEWFFNLWTFGYSLIVHIFSIVWFEHFFPFDNSPSTDRKFHPFGVAGVMLIWRVLQSFVVVYCDCVLLSQTVSSNESHCLYWKFCLVDYWTPFSRMCYRWYIDLMWYFSWTYLCLLGTWLLRFGGSVSGLSYVFPKSVLRKWRMVQLDHLIRKSVVLVEVRDSVGVYSTVSGPLVWVWSFRYNFRHLTLVFHCPLRRFLSSISFSISFLDPVFLMSVWRLQGLGTSVQSRCLWMCPMLMFSLSYRFQLVSTPFPLEWLPYFWESLFYVYFPVMGCSSPLSLPPYTSQTPSLEEHIVKDQEEKGR